MNSSTLKQLIIVLSISVIFTLIPATSFAETTESNLSQNNSSDITQPKDTKEENNRGEAAKIYIQSGKNLTINRIWHRASDLSKVKI